MAGKDAQVGKWRGRLLGVELGIELCSSRAGSSGEASKGGGTRPVMVLCRATGGAASIRVTRRVGQGASVAAGIPNAWGHREVRAARGARGLCVGRKQGEGKRRRREKKMEKKEKREREEKEKETAAGFAAAVASACSSFGGKQRTRNEEK